MPLVASFDKLVIYCHTLNCLEKVTKLVILERLYSIPEVTGCVMLHDDVIKWRHFPRYWPFVRGIHRSRWIPRTKASDAELWCFLDLRLNNRLSKQPWGWWFETPSWSLWRHSNATYSPLCWCSTECTVLKHTFSEMTISGSLFTKLYRKTSYRQISQSLEAARNGFSVVLSLWYLTGASAATHCLSTFGAIHSF